MWGGLCECVYVFVGHVCICGTCVNACFCVERVCECLCMFVWEVWMGECGCVSVCVCRGSVDVSASVCL